MGFDSDRPCRSWRVWPIIDRFSEFCRSADVPCLDLTGLFQQAVREGGLPYSFVDSHWSAQGHALVAERLASDLTQRGWLSGSGIQRVK